MQITVVIQSHARVTSKDICLFFIIFRLDFLYLSKKRPKINLQFLSIPNFDLGENPVKAVTRKKKFSTFLQLDCSNFSLTL